jgi:hypothetical protein
MFIRRKFVTNSSSTSFVGFGVCIEGHDEDIFDKLEEVWSNGIEYAVEPCGDSLYIYVDMPKLSITKEGDISISNPEKFKEKYLLLRTFLQENSIDEPITVVDGCWRDG